MPNIISVAAPVYFKFGLRNSPDIYPSGLHLEDLAVKMGRERVRRARIDCGYNQTSIGRGSRKRS